MRKFSFIERTLYLCAGASLEGLAQCPESEHRKYGFIGAIILLTSMFAMLSGGYALYYIFQSQLYAVLFALMWGLFILNLDRFIVSSMRKSESFWREFAQAIPRLVLAFIIAIIISRPLEIRVFAEEVEGSILEQRGTRKEDVLKEFNTYISGIKEDFNARIADEVAQLETYRTERAETCAKRDKAHARYLCERDGTCGTGETGMGAEAVAKRRRYLQLERECAALTARTEKLQDRIDSRRDAFDRGLSGSVADSLGDDEVLSLEESAEINLLKKERDKRLAEIEKSFSMSFSSMNSALWELQQGDKAVMAISFIISLLFIVVEVSPVTVKLLARKGPYDYYLDFERDSAEAQYLRGRDQLYKEKSTEFKREMEHLERQKHVETFKAFQDAKAPMEKEMLGKMLEQWKEKADLSGESLEDISAGLKRMIGDYARINNPGNEEEGDLPRFRYPSFAQPDEAPRQAPQQPAAQEQQSSPGLGSLINRFLIVPMTFMVTVVAFLMALKFQPPISPYLVAFFAGLLYVTVSIVFFSMRSKPEKDE